MPRFETRAAARRGPSGTGAPAGALLLALVLAAVPTFAAATLLGAAPARAAAADPAVQGEAAVSAGQAPDTSAVSAGQTPDTEPPGPTPRDAGRALERSRRALDTPLHERLVSVLGTGLLVLLGWLLSADRRGIDWRLVVSGIALQVAFALVVLKTGPGQSFFAAVNDVFIGLLGFTREGARFIFGNLVDPNVPVGIPAGDPPSGAPLPDGAVTAWARTGAYFAFTVLPIIVFLSSLTTLLYHLGFLQRLVNGIAWVMQRTLRTSGAETLSASANVFLGQTEAPLLIKPYIASMTSSELMCVMTAGFANTAGSVMVAYVGLLSPFFPGIAGHLLAASVMSAPAAIVFAKILLPEREQPATRGVRGMEVASPDVNVIDATARGASEGLALALNVGAMLLAFIALLALVNAGLGWAGGLVGVEGLTLERILGWLLAPLALAMGVPPRDAVEVGSLLGIKTAVNEFVAFLRLAGDLQAGTDLSPRSVIIATYALAGFSNFASIAIQIGGIGGLAPERRPDLSRLGLRAMVAGSLASFMTATIAGSLL